MEELGPQSWGTSFLRPKRTHFTFPLGLIYQNVSASLTQSGFRESV
jgi:hypothetical protein